MNEFQLIDQIQNFLESIGIKVNICSIEQPTFLPGIMIEKGELWIDKEKLSYPGDLLHDAGHIAVSAKEKRHLLSGNNINDAGEEIAAILWSFAASKVLNIPLSVLFHKDGYKGESDWLINSFESQNYIGLPLLEWMGMTLSEQKATEQGIQPFPNMIKWLRD